MMELLGDTAVIERVLLLQLISVYLMTHKTLFRDVCFSTNIHKQERGCLTGHLQCLVIPIRWFFFFCDINLFFSIPSVV